MTVRLRFAGHVDPHGPSRHRVPIHRPGPNRGCDPRRDHRRGRRRPRPHPVGPQMLDLVAVESMGDLRVEDRATHRAYGRPRRIHSSCQKPFLWRQSHALCAGFAVPWRGAHCSPCARTLVRISKPRVGTNSNCSLSLPTLHRHVVHQAERRISTLCTSPIITAQATRCDPPYDTNGRGNPDTGVIPIVIPMF